MILKLLRFESEIHLGPGVVATLQIEDRSLFARVVSSLLSEQAEEALEPYALWGDDGKKLSPRGAFLVLDALPTIPLSDKKLLSKLYAHIASAISDDDAVEARVAAAMTGLESTITERNVELWGTYDFLTSLNVPQLLKAFGFQPYVEEGQPLAEQLVSFFGLCADIGLSQPLVLVNGKSFFAENALTVLAEQSFFYGIPLLLLESWNDATQYEWERKTTIDQWFLEN